MPLRNRNEMPLGGFYYREPKLNWVTPNPFLPFSMIVGEIQAVRMANPSAGLNPASEACAADLDSYTCARLHYDTRWCLPQGSEIALAAEISRKPRKCGGCGARRKTR